MREFVMRTFGMASVTLDSGGEGVEQEGFLAMSDLDLHEDARGHHRPAAGRDTVGGRGILGCADLPYFHPAEETNLRGDPNKARERLSWRPAITYSKSVAGMTHLTEVQRHDLRRVN